MKRAILIWEIKTYEWFKNRTMVADIKVTTQIGQCWARCTIDRQDLEFQNHLSASQIRDGLTTYRKGSASDWWELPKIDKTGYLVLRKFYLCRKRDAKKERRLYNKFNHNQFQIHHSKQWFKIVLDNTGEKNVIEYGHLWKPYMYFKTLPYLLTVPQRFHSSLVEVQRNWN